MTIHLKYQSRSGKLIQVEDNYKGSYYLFVDGNLKAEFDAWTLTQMQASVQSNRALWCLEVA